jgi:hypothetical protein
VTGSASATAIETVTVGDVVLNSRLNITGWKMLGRHGSIFHLVLRSGLSQQRGTARRALAGTWVTPCDLWALGG